MECNKEDAVKALHVAENKIEQEDYPAAKKFILKAQRLFPSLSGLPQMIAVADIHCIACEVSAENLPSRWHEILQVEPNVGEEAIRKQYRKLMLLLHPDKNKSAGAESAFKLVKAAYEAFEKEKLEKLSADTSNSDPTSKLAFFWTQCPKCKTRSEHVESLEHQYVQCLGCLCPFVAVRIPPTEECQSKSQHESVNSQQKQTNPESQPDGVAAEKKTTDFDDIKEKGKVPSSSSEEFGKAKKRKSRLKITKTRSRKQEDFTWATSEGTSRRKQRRTRLSSASDTDLSNGTSFKESPSDFAQSNAKKKVYCDADVNIGDHSDQHMHNSAKNDSVNVGDSSHQFTNETAKNDRVNIGDCSHKHTHNSAKDDMAKIQDSRRKLFEKLKGTIMSEFNEGEFQAVEVRQDDTHEAASKNNNVGGDKLFQLKLTVSFMQATTNLHAQAAASENCMVGGSEIWEEDQESVQCQVPDNDVYNFDSGRQEEKFEVGQIWAVYDDADGLPRFYAHIAEVISVRPFHVRMNWLYPAKTVSKDVRAWVEAGFAYTCGEFTLRKKVTRKSAGLFSHIMAHEAGRLPRTICIYPQKGDVWALYNVWKPRKGTTRVCEPVEVISHYSEELGVEVAALFKVPEYTSIYCRKGMMGARFIPASELTRFSHQIPAHYLVGNELSGLPEDSVDLDMAAITAEKATPC